MVRKGQKLLRFKGMWQGPEQGTPPRFLQSQSHQARQLPDVQKENMEGIVYAACVTVDQHT